MNTQNYFQHPLNTSKTKEAHLFPKDQRFPRRHRLATQVIYHLPSTNNKRATGFGFGNKLSLAVKSSFPPPTSYNLPSDFEKKDVKNVTSLGQGRQKVCFGSFIWQTLKRIKDNPSPDKYNISSHKMKVGGNFGQRIHTDYSIKYHKQIPGPGAYKLSGTEIGSGSYMLSTYKNNTSPRYFSEIKPNKQTAKNRTVHQTVSYDIQQKEFGKSFNSKYKNNGVNSFSKSKRQGLQNKNLLFTPGFKYRRFSEFNGLPQK